MLGHRGFATGVITTRGRAAHTARRDEGVDAIAMMARVIVGLEDLDARLNAGPGHPLLGHSAIVASLVRGGSELFTYPADCEAEFVWRMLPGQTRTALTADIEAIFATLKARDPRFDASLEWRLWREPMLAAEDAPIVGALRAAAGNPVECAAPWWTDAALIQAAGIPTAIFGPAGGGIHSIDEWVDLDSLARLESILLNVTRSFCG
jgi:acetylornithine deacetylase